MPKEITIEEIRKKAEESWEGCHHCDETDKQMWINGFISGYLIGQDDTVIIKKPPMLKKELQDCLFSIKIAHDYLKTYGLQDHDKDHVLMHLKIAIRMIEEDSIEKEDKDTLKNV